MRRLTEYDEQRFWALVALPDADGHMSWLGTVNGAGYGTFRAWGIQWRANRLALYLAEGLPEQLPGGSWIPANWWHAAHRPVICHAPGCVAPLHLYWATPSQNQQDRILDGTAKRTGKRRGTRVPTDR
jgi:hypothetical protein